MNRCVWVVRSNFKGLRHRNFFATLLRRSKRPYEYKGVIISGFFSNLTQPIPLGSLGPFRSFQTQDFWSPEIWPYDHFPNRLLMLTYLIFQTIKKFPDMFDNKRIWIPDTFLVQSLAGYVEDGPSRSFLMLKADGSVKSSFK